MMAAARAEPPSRVPLFKEPPPTLAASTSLIDMRMAEELEYLRRRLDALGGLLSSDTVFVYRYASALQDIDLINQTMGHLATITKTADKEAAVERVSLGELRARLSRKPQGQL